MADTARGGRSSASPSSPLNYESATDPKATEAYNLAHVKPAAVEVEVRKNVRLTDGPGTDANEVDLESIASRAGSGQSVVTMPHAVYSEHIADGPGGHVMRQLRYRAGQVVPVAALRAEQEQVKAFRPVSETK